MDEILPIFDVSPDLVVKRPREMDCSCTLSEEATNRFRALLATRIFAWDGSVRIRLEPSESNQFSIEDLFEKCFLLGLWLLESVAKEQKKSCPKS